MKFRWFVGACLVLIAYGVLYSHLPCWAQLMNPTVECELKAVRIATPAEREASLADDAATAGKMVQDLIDADERARKRGR